jgi:signal transduction histidine kinase
MEPTKEIADLSLAYLMDEAPVIVIRLDLSGTILSANRFAETILGENIAGRHLNELALNQDFCRDFASIEGGTDYRLNMPTQTGLPQTFYFRFYPANEYMIAFGRFDYDEMESMRRKIVQLNNELSNLTRTLHKKNAELQQLNEQKNRLLGMTAHDLRHPLGVIQMYSEFLTDEARDRLSDEQMEFLQIIRMSSTNMRHMISDYLDISKIEAGKLDLHMQSVDLSAVLRENIQLNRVLADKKHISISFEEITPITDIQADKLKIEQVLNNLINNAVKFTPENKRIEVFLEKNGSQAIITVRDQGIGIPAEIKDRLFTPYEKARHRHSEFKDSSGLGLAIAKKIVECHGGRIWFESVENEGSRFFVSLPMSE